MLCLVGACGLKVWCLGVRVKGLGEVKASFRDKGALDSPCPACLKSEN